MNFRQFLDVANALNQGSTEAEWRSAISRAYYAAFHVACEGLRSLGFVVPRADQAHAFAWRRWSNSGHMDINRVGNDLNDLRKMRNQADYDDHRFMPHTLGLDAANMGEEIVRLIDESLQEPVRSQIMETIKTYERDILKEVTWQP